jgi:hypothetical protein
VLPATKARVKGDEPQDYPQEVMATCDRCREFNFVGAVISGNKMLRYEPNPHFRTERFRGTICHCGGRVRFSH